MKLVASVNLNILQCTCLKLSLILNKNSRKEPKSILMNENY